MKTETLKIKVNDGDPVTALLYPAVKQKRDGVTIVLGHGAGANQLSGFMRMVAASGSLTGGDVEHAVALASEAIRLGFSLQSARYVKYLTDFYSSLTAKDAALSREVSDLLRTHYPALILPI